MPSPRATRASATTPKNQGRIQKGTAIATGTVAAIPQFSPSREAWTSNRCEPGGNRRVLGMAAGAGIDPVGVHAVEPIAKAQPVRGTQVNRREVDLQAIAPGRERDRRVEGDTLPVDAQRFDERRGKRQRFDRLRIDDRGALHRREPESAVTRADAGVTVAALESRRRESVLDAEQAIAHLRRTPVEIGVKIAQRHAREPARARDPEIP